MNDNSPQPQRVLVTGASGAIGTPVCRHLLARGHHVRGLYHICAAAVEAGVQRLALASSLQVISGIKKEGTIHIEDGTAPNNHYALTKVWAEDIGEMYARDTKIIPGHGPLATPADLKTYLRMIKESQATVAAGLKAGKSLEELQAAGVGEEWASWSWGFISTKRWVATLHRSQ